MLPHQTQHHDVGDKITVIYSLKITPEVKKEVTTQVYEKVKEAAQTDEEVQRDEGELAGQNNKEEIESECTHVHFWGEFSVIALLGIP